MARKISSGVSSSLGAKLNLPGIARRCTLLGFHNRVNAVRPQYEPHLWLAKQLRSSAGEQSALQSGFDRERHAGFF